MPDPIGTYTCSVRACVRTCLAFHAIIFKGCHSKTNWRAHLPVEEGSCSTCRHRQHCSVKRCQNRGWIPDSNLAHEQFVLLCLRSFCLCRRQLPRMLELLGKRRDVNGSLNHMHDYSPRPDSPTRRRRGPRERVIVHFFPSTCVRRRGNGTAKLRGRLYQHQVNCRVLVYT